MGKLLSTDESSEIRDLLHRVEEKLSSSRALNGGFERMEEKIDRLLDPEDGIYAKVAKTEVLVQRLTLDVQQLTNADNENAKKIAAVQATAEATKTEMDRIAQITGTNHTDLTRAIKTTKGLWKIVAVAGTAFVAAAAKFLWDVFTK